MSKSILIIDDSTAIREVVKITLKGAGYDVIEADDGDVGLSKLNSDVNLIICDVNMPRVDGLTFLRTIRDDARYQDYRFIPVLMLTTESGKDVKAEGKEAGARAWLVKPFVPEKLLRAVEKLTLVTA